MLDLAGVTPEFLSKANRSRVLQVRPSGLGDPVEFPRLGRQRFAEMFQCRKQVLLDGGQGSHVKGGRDHVVA